MARRIPDTDDFYIYRRSAVDLTEADRPTDITYTPDPLPQPNRRATHLLIHGLSDDWQISLGELQPSEIAGNPNHPIWMCLCGCPLGGTVTVTPPFKHESSQNG